MTDLSTNESNTDQAEQGGFSDLRSDLDPSSGGGGELTTVADDVGDVGEDAEAGVGSFLGGTLQKAYILILPPASPAGGPMESAEMAAEVTGSLATQDVAGSGIDNDSALQAAEAQTVGTGAVRVDSGFNPTHYSISKSATWTHLPDKSSYPTATPQFIGSSQRQLSLEVFLDASYSTSGSVQGAVDLLFATLQPTRLSLLTEPSPPFVLFGWGENLAFLAYMESVSAEFTLFRADGTPLRAVCQISMKEIPISLPSQNPTSGGRARRTCQTVAGDTLASLSHRGLGKPTMWRAIAETNGIEDPTRIPNGTTLFIPPKADAAGMA